MRTSIRRPRFLVLTLLSIALVLSAARGEARGYPGCSPGRYCLLEGESCADRSIIASDALERHPLTNRPLGFFPNYRTTTSEPRPVLPSRQTLRWAEMLAISLDLRAKVTLNPAKESTTTMESLQPGGVPFFPARQTVTLYLLWHFGEGGLVLFNKDPIVLTSDVPLTGFPPAFGPGYHDSKELTLFNLAQPDGPAVVTLPPPQVRGDVERLFDVTLSRINGQTARLRVATRRPGLTVPARIYIAGTPGFTGIAPQEVAAEVGNTPLERLVKVVPPSVPCFDYLEAWAVSLDPEHLGVGTAMRELPNARTCPQPDPMAVAGPKQTAPAGARVTLQGKGQSRNGVVHFSWVAPQGVRLARPASATPTFVVPATNIERELIFTLFVDDGVNISPPSSTVVVALPAPAATAASTPSASSPGRSLSGRVVTALAVVLVSMGIGLLFIRSRNFVTDREPVP
jgi:hypothetical protein